MKQYKMNCLIVLAVAALASGIVACTQEEPVHTADVRADTTATVKPVVNSAHDAESHHSEPSVADWKTELQVKMVLLEKLGADSLKVNVTSREGDVDLTGVVSKRETKELAEAMAKSIPSVTGVSNDIRLESNLDNPSEVAVAAGEADAEWSDAMLSTKVRLALVDVMGSDGFRIGTEVASGMVTLEFDPELSADRRAEALKTVHGVEGVAEVVSVDKA